MTKEEKIAEERQIISDFMNYFVNNRLDMNDTEVLQKLQDYISRIFQLEVEEMGYKYSPDRDDSENTFELCFVSKPDSFDRGWYDSGRKWENEKIVQGKPRITYNVARLFKNLDSADVDVRLDSCKQIFGTNFHELQHHRQHLMTRQNVSSNESLRYGRDFACTIVLHEDWYSRDKKTGNYDEYITENNANQVGYSQYIETMGIHDQKLEYLRDIEIAKFNIARYKADVDSRDGKSHYNSDGSQERDDVTVQILDSFICEKGRLYLLYMFPILQKEYNLDGTKKTAVELIRNMQQEVNDISQNTELSAKEKAILIRDGQEMYYELIYRQIEQCTLKQISAIVSKIGKNKSKEIFQKISAYFQRELENRPAKAAKMGYALAKLADEFILPSNNGKIKVEQNGKKVQMTFDEFIKIIDPQLLEKKFNITKGKNKEEMSASEFIKKYCFDNLSQSGMMTLKDGTEITAKEFVEKYFLQIEKLSEDYIPRKFFEDTILPENLWKIQKKFRKRFRIYYGDKKDVLSTVIEQIDKSVEQEKKMKFIRKIIASYDATEDYNQYEYRKKHEDDTTLQVLNGIQNGELSAIDLNYFENNREFNISIAIPEIVRLLKAADNITIDGGKNYLEEFANIPNVIEILLLIKNSESYKKMSAEAEERRKTGTIQQHKKTIAEEDKELAQEYLRSGNMWKSTVSEELAYRAEKIKGISERVFNAKSEAEIPERIKKYIAVERIIARQQGKVPGKIVLRNRMIVFEIDTQRKNNIAPEDIVDSSLKEDTGKSEIDSVTVEIRKTQTKDLQQAQQQQ